MDFCPASADWGNVAEWAAVVVGLIAAAATFTAVFVALRTSRESLKVMTKLRDEERAYALEVGRLRAVARSITFDHELYQLGGTVHEIVKMLDPVNGVSDPRRALELLQGSNLPGMPMLTRFAGELDAFGEQDASVLLSILSSWDAISATFRPGDLSNMPAQILRLGLAAQRSTLISLLGRITKAREVTRKWAIEVNPNLPPSDWNLDQPHAV